MRSPGTSLAVAALVLAPLTAAAQAPPADTIVQVNRQFAGNVAQYEAARKKHMAWHKSQSDKWAWNVYEVTTGPDSGAYLVTTGDHRFADFDAWQSTLGAADTENAQQTMGGTIDRTMTTYWSTVNAMSRLPPTQQLAPYLSVTHFLLKPGQDTAMMAAITKIRAALESAKYAPHAIWYRLVNGGALSHYVVITPLATLGALDGPNVRTALMSHLGPQKATALLSELFATVESSHTEMLQYRADLSYVP